MSSFVPQLIFVFTCIFAKTAAKVVCEDPIEISELRILQSKLCVDISGSSGGGNVVAYECEGLDDQQMILCGDGTLRNKKAPNNCLTPMADGNVMSTTCLVYPAIPDNQKWKFGRSKDFVDNGGIRQEAREIINVKSGLCLDVAKYNGEGNILTYHCENKNDQYFYFRSRGTLLAHGRLLNERSGLCLDVAGYSRGHGQNILIYNCEDAADQYFSFYENGELVNKQSRLCADVSGHDGAGNIQTRSCEDETDQMWFQPSQYCHGGYCAFRNRKSGNCIDVSGSAAILGSNVLAYSCDGAPDQSFRWLAEKWITPAVIWSAVGCNQNGKVSQQISDTISYSSSISQSTSLEISSTIEADVVFGSVSVTATVSTTLAMKWERSQTKTREVTFSCDRYDDGKPFTGGCMWQLKLTTREATKADVLSWTPMIIKCTKGNKKPHCPPFTRCADDECLLCEEMPGTRKKRSIGKLLTWEEVVKTE